MDDSEVDDAEGRLQIGETEQVVQDDLREGIALGVRDIPAIFINGARFEGELTIRNLSASIKELSSVQGTGKGTKKAA